MIYSRQIIQSKIPSGGGYIYFLSGLHIYRYSDPFELPEMLITKFIASFDMTITSGLLTWLLSFEEMGDTVSSESFPYIGGRIKINGDAHTDLLYPVGTRHKIKKNDVVRIVFNSQLTYASYMFCRLKYEG